MDILVIAALVLILGTLTAWMLPYLVCPWREQVTLRKLAGVLGFRYHGWRTLGIPRRGRVTGTFHDRDCTIETLKQMGVDPYTRMVVSIDNPLAYSFDVVQHPTSASSGDKEQRQEPLQIVGSTPDGLARTVLRTCDLEGRAPQFPRQVRASGYHLSLSGYMMRLEHRPRWLCFGPIERDVIGFRALLETLCDAADAIERSETAQPDRVPGAS